MTDSRSFEVTLGEHSVGTLTESATGEVSYRCRDSYLELAERPVLGQIFEDDLRRIYRGKKQNLPPFFLNLIPEAGLLRNVIAEEAGIDSGDDLALLEFTGEDLPGAIVVRPARHEDRVEPSREEAGTESDSETGKQKAGAEPENEGSAADRLHFSLAGVQMKFSMLLAEDKLTLPARGASGDWIVKFPSPTFEGLPENEISMLEWARAAGFDVPECHLFPIEALESFPRRFAVEGESVLAIRRYDREGETRIHQEDFAQVVGLPPTKKYDQITSEILVVLARNILGETGAIETLRRLALVIACGNNDAHLKNWSLVYPDGIRAEWSPLYDQVATVAWSESGRLDRKLSLKLGGVKDFGRIDRATFDRLADKVDLDRASVRETVRATLTTLRDTWGEKRADWPIRDVHAEALRDHWRRVPLLREIGSLA